MHAGSGWRPVSLDADVCGESPVWSAAEQALYWVDIKRPLLRRLQWPGGAVQDWPMPAFAGCVGLHRPDSLLVAVGTGLALFAPEAGTFCFLAAPEAAIPARRFNDGRCGPDGRFWVTSMCTTHREPSAALYCLEPDGRCRRTAECGSIPNGLAWSLDGRTLYFADTPAGTIDAFAYEPATGTASGRRTFAVTTGPGGPDGATVDAEGFLWSARYGGGCLIRYAPDGHEERRIALPVQHPTSVAFGGPDLHLLFATTASQELSAAELREQPLAGRVLVLDVGVRGRPEPAYAKENAQ